MSLLTQVPSYCIVRDGRRANSEIDRLFDLALRWWPEIEIPANMVSATSRKRGEPPEHSGAVALKTLGQGGTISQHQLDAAIAYLTASIAYYRSASNEPFPGRNVEAIGNLQALLDEVAS